jgi:dTDP-4-dehydrorhamnose 3,5-epimerase
LVRVLRGAVYDVAADIRKGSPSYGKWVGVTLSADKWNQLLIPVGFAHGFMTLEPDTEVLYKVSARYSQEHEGAIRWNDPALGIEWPDPGVEPVLSEKDELAPALADFDSPFTYEG